MLIFLVKLYREVFHPIVFSKKQKCLYFWLDYIEECSTLSFSAKMEKCSYFWLDYIQECSTLSFSAKNGKVFIFLVRLYRGVFHPIVFSLMVNFLSLQDWEGDWSPTGCLLVTLLYFMCGDWSCCLMHCLSFVD